MATFHCLSSIFKFLTGLGDIYHIAQSKGIYPRIL